jgi:malonyl-CoA O-methyltransferase
MFSPMRRLKSLDAYALWAENYPPFPHNRFMEIEQAAMLRLMPNLASCHVLDVACGSGRYGLIAERNRAALTIGTDNSIPMLQTGRRAGVNTPLIQSTMTALPFTAAAFDVVICALATGHLPAEKMQRSVSEMARLIKPSGSILISDFHSAIYARGGKRTFTTVDGKQHQVEHYPHTLADYKAAAASVGLQVSETIEPQAEVQGMNISVILAMRFQKL